MFRFLKNKLNVSDRALRVANNFKVPLEAYATMGELVPAVTSGPARRWGGHARDLSPVRRPPHG